MCGRYASARKREDLLAEFRIERDRVDASLAPDYNVAPTKPVYAVMTRGSRGDGCVDRFDRSVGSCGWQQHNQDWSGRLWRTRHRGCRASPHG